MKTAACADQPLALFFEDRWHELKIPRTQALEHARTFCNACPLSAACLAMEMDAEAGAAVQHRAGVFGGFTPEQRHALERRGFKGPYCPRCSKQLDPRKLRAGQVRCPKCKLRTDMKPIPDRGDQWNDRHTKLARDVIAWLVENVEPDCAAPSAMALSRKLSVRVNDVRRVYEALLDDHLIEQEGDLIVRRAAASTTRVWVPPHLRVSTP